MVVDVEANVSGIGSNGMDDGRLEKTEGTAGHANLPVNSMNDVAGKTPSVDLKCRERVADSDAEEHDQSGKKLNLSAINVSATISDN